ncbi:unnamed protein product [Clavelina lepadiformis]|uniref:Claudin n=1 Tax=Clavelina lepadiformis TaxID=159417 RepID=A0ABP0GC82_CLALP
MLSQEENSKHGGRGAAVGCVVLMWIMFYIMFWMLCFPDWEHSAWQIEENLMGRVKRFNGLFFRCISPKQGSFKCDNYGKPSIQQSADIQACRALMCIATGFSFIGVLVALLALDCTTMVEPNTKAKNMTALVAGVLFVLAADLQAQRALMVIAVVTSLLGLIIGMVSLRCTTMVDSESKNKSIIGIVSGVLFLLAGVCCGGAVSWWAAKVTTQFYNAFYANNEFKYEYGACLYVGWIAMLLALIAGLILTCGSCRGIKEDKDTYKPYTYQPATSKPEKPSTKTEYV